MLAKELCAEALGKAGEIDDIEEEAACSAADAGPRDSNGEMLL